MITAILAQSKDNIIGTVGVDGPKLPWRLPPDLKRFRELTTGHTVIMGRTTFESIGKALPNRRNVVVSRQHPSEWSVELKHDDNVEWAGDPEHALAFDDVFVIGGGQIYAALWDRVDRVELTRVDMNVGLGLVFAWNPAPFVEVSRSERHEYEGLGYEFVTYERRRS